MNPYVKTLEDVWNNPLHKFKHVSIHEEALERFAQEWAKKELRLPDWREEVFPQEDDDTFIDFVIVSGAINYCFTDFRTDEEYDVEYPEGSGKIWHGSYAMFAALKRAMDNGTDILNRKFLSRLTLEEVRHILRPVRPKSTFLPMIEARLMNLLDLGPEGRAEGPVEGFAQIFKKEDFRMFGDAEATIEEYEYIGISEYLCIMFRDYSTDVSRLSRWDIGRELTTRRPELLCFYNRAQLVPMMYHGRAMSSGGKLQPIRDPENFGPICDYWVPKALRHLGVISYSPELAYKVDNGRVIKKDSREEIELRLIGCAQPMCILLELINELRPQLGLPKITMAELYYAMLRIGREVPGRHHYTYTTAY